MLRKCAQSIFRLEITLKSRFLEENRKKNFLKKNHVGGPPEVDELRKSEKKFRVETQFYPDFQGQT